MIILKGILPKWSNINGIALFPFILTKKNPSKTLLNHERIHIRQQVELLVIPFYIIYIVEWFFKGYYGISFEREAYENDKHLNYLSKRKIFGQWRQAKEA